MHLAKSVFRRRGANPVFIWNISLQLSCMKSCIFPKNLAKRGQNGGCRFDSYQSHFSGFGPSKTARRRRKSGDKLTSFDPPCSARAFSAQDSKCGRRLNNAREFESLHLRQTPGDKSPGVSLCKNAGVPGLETARHPCYDKCVESEGKNCFFVESRLRSSAAGRKNDSEQMHIRKGDAYALYNDFGGQGSHP